MTTIQELTSAGQQLEAALHKYVDACSTFANSYPGHVENPSVDLIIDQVQATLSHESKIQEARIILNRARNRSAIVPINSLPLEILGNIFKLVLESQCCVFRHLIGKDQSKNSHLMYPELLSHVCSHWRQLSISLCPLWSHIDLPPIKQLTQFVNGFVNKNLLARAKVFVARAGSTQLDVHLFQPDGRCESDIDFTDLYSLVAPHMRSLDLKANICSHYILALQHFLANSSPGLLKELSIRDRATPAHSYIEPREVHFDLNHWSLDMPQQALDEVLLPINVLRLNGIFFRPESQAYQGLVELVIRPQAKLPRITESRLIQILESSPRLHTLCIGVLIEDIDLLDPPRSVVTLNELEVLNLIQMRNHKPECLLRLIAPGPKPLRLMLGVRDNLMNLLRHEWLQGFFARSNVTELLVRGKDTSLELYKLLEYLPSLRIVSLSSFVLKGTRTPSDTYEQCIQRSQLEALYLLQCEIDPNHFLWMAEVNRTRPIVLKIWNCLWYDTDDCMCGDDSLQKELSVIFPIKKNNPPCSSVSQDGTLFIWD
ncbi:F-box-like domain containing protein [Ceratobasidium theobromae]|uniref:F-box-like domain containing protein n=1 Tax=Ceratobasidium theobromae TaxID=1582974 RepID=A0A5N5Q8Y2_9AGAM|nr:F-box-like domain containing protein [Ceratobasidium theobromae]